MATIFQLKGSAVKDEAVLKLQPASSTGPGPVRRVVVKDRPLLVVATSP